MNQTVRWWVAGLTTAVAFSLPAWISGAFVLPHLMESSAERWVVATALGVAVAAFVALWGKSWATRDSSRQETNSPRAEAPRGSLGPRAISVGGELHGIASTGDHTRNIQSPAIPPVPPPQDPVPPTHADPAPAPAPAAGERSISTGGSISGIASTGDDVSNTQQP